MKNIFKKKIKAQNTTATEETLPFAQTMRNLVESYIYDEEKKKLEKTRKYADTKIAPIIREYSQNGISNYSIDKFSFAYDIDYLITILEKKGYIVNEFKNKIEICW